MILTIFHLGKDIFYSAFGIKKVFFIIDMMGNFFLFFDLLNTGINHSKVVVPSSSQNGDCSLACFLNLVLFINFKSSIFGRKVLNIGKI